MNARAHTARTYHIEKNIETRESEEKKIESSASDPFHFARFFCYLIYLHSLVCDYTLIFFLSFQKKKWCNNNKKYPDCCYRWWIQSFIQLNLYLSFSSSWQSLSLSLWQCTSYSMSRYLFICAPQRSSVSHLYIFI